MTTAAMRPGPNGRAARPSLGDQLDRLDGILNGLADALNQTAFSVPPCTERSDC